MEQIHNILNSSDKLQPATHMIDESASAMPNSNKVSGMRLYTMAELMSQEFPEAIWVVEGLIPEGLTVMSAQPASFKTWLLLSIAAHVAEGAKFLDQFPTEPMGVLMIDEENSARMLQQRLRLLGVSAEVPVHFMVEQNVYLDDHFVTKIIMLCKEKNIGLITFDSLVRIHKGDENKSGDMAEVFGMLRRFTKANINVIVTHHNRKGGAKSENPAQEMRGSSDILAAVDCHLSVKRDEPHRLLLTQTKVRISEEHDPVEIEIVLGEDSLKLLYGGSLGPIENKRTRTKSAIIRILGNRGSLNQKDLISELEAEDIKPDPKLTRDVLNRLIDHNEIEVFSGKGNEKLYRCTEPVWVE